MKKLNIEEFEVGEVAEDELQDMLDLRNSEFPPYTLEEWNMFHSTAVAAKKDGKFWGCIPLQFRDYNINSSISIPVVFENAVLSHKDMRGVGLGTAMMDTAADFLEERVDAMCVLRGGERTIGYRFYRKTGHGDLCYRTFLTIDQPRDIAPHYEIFDWKETIPYDTQLRKLFDDMYAQFGGYWRREAGYYKEIVELHVLRHHPSKVIFAESDGEIEGYLITSKSSRAISIYELAVKEGRDEIITKLLETAESYAHQEDIPLSYEVNREHPLYQKLIDYGFSGVHNTSTIMARILRGDRIFSKLTEGTNAFDSLKLTVVTPHRDLILNDPENPKEEGFIYCKESQLARLLFCRLDLSGAVNSNLVRLSMLPEQIETELYKIFRFCPWVVNGMDYV